MPAPMGNQNAAKPSEERKDAILTIRLTRADAAMIEEAASPELPAGWARRHLLAAARRRKKKN